METHTIWTIIIFQVGGYLITVQLSTKYSFIVNKDRETFVLNLESGFFELIKGKDWEQPL